MKNRFHERLRSVLDERGLTQRKAAADLGIPASTFGGYAQGSTEPEYEMLKKMAAYLGVSTDYLLGYEPEKASGTGYDEAELLRIYRSLNAEERRVYLRQGRAFLAVKEQ